MGSENHLNDGTSIHQSDKPILCANGCGFFGTAATMNLCSKCYRDHRLSEEQAASAKAAVEKSMNPISTASTVALVVENKSLTAAPAAAPEPESEPTQTAPPVTKPSNRCGTCNKKVGVMGFKCRCGTTFCGSHRYPEEHDCEFDFKSLGREAIAKANPIVKAAKLERF